MLAPADPRVLDPHSRSPFARPVKASDSIDRYGAADGAPVIALHGAVANRKSWLPLSRMLRGDLELVCPDLPGHGARANEVFSIAESLATIDRLVANLAPRRVVLAGDSLGGYLALLAAARDDSERIAAVCAGGCTWSMTGLSGVLARASDLPVRVLEAAFGTSRLERLATAALPRVTDAETAREIAGAGLRLRSRSESLAELSHFDLAATVRAVRVPIAIVNGAYDWPTRMGEGVVLRNARSATVDATSKCGHGVGLLAPQAFARAIEALATASCIA